MVNLESLLEAGGYVQAGYEDRPVTWTNDEGKSFEFSVQVKKEMTAADHEFIYLGLGDRRSEKGKTDASFMARRLHRMVRVFDPGSGKYDPIPLEVAERMKTSLTRAILEAANGVQVEPETPEDAEKN